MDLEQGKPLDKGRYLYESKSRGVKEVGIIISDALSGIENTINKHFPGTEVQKSLPQITEKILHN